MSESNYWRPSKWTESGICRRLERVYRIARREIEHLVGPHMAGTIGAQFLTEMKSQRSKLELRRRGVKLIGDL